MSRCGTTGDENYSPPPEGCRGGLSRTGGPTPKADAFCPSREGIFSGRRGAVYDAISADVPLLHVAHRQASSNPIMGPRELRLGSP
jgi:hypothetical protein